MTTHAVTALTSDRYGRSLAVTFHCSLFANILNVVFLSPHNVILLSRMFEDFFTAPAVTLQYKRRRTEVLITKSCGTCTINLCFLFHDTCMVDYDLPQV